MLVITHSHYVLKVCPHAPHCTLQSQYKPHASMHPHRPMHSPQMHNGNAGHIFFDTFPLNEDPVREAALNVRRFKALWAAAGKLAGSSGGGGQSDDGGGSGIGALLAGQDAFGALELLEGLGL